MIDYALVTVEAPEEAIALHPPGGCRGAADGGGMDLPNVAAWLGHSDATVTLKRSMKPGELEAPAALDALISAEAGG